MGNAAPRAQPLTQQDSASQYRTYLADFAPRSVNLLFKELLSDGRFLKSIRCTCDDGKVIVKIYRKYDPNESLQGAEAALRRLTLAFSIDKLQPNLMPYAHYRLSTKYHVAFMARQYFLSNLYDRICSRPFLTLVEKKWIAFQILRAVDQSHTCGICHGDIKQENLMVTSWNWVFLTDFAPFKPTYIPEDDPADYNYYFCAIDATRRACCLAPERFYGKASAAATPASAASGAAAMANPGVGVSKFGESGLIAEELDRHVLDSGVSDTGTSGTTSSRIRREGNLLESMDIFSVGCVIAELFLGGKPLFDLPSLLRYRTGDDALLKATLRKINDPQLEEMLLHMLQLDPRARLSAREYLSRYKGSKSEGLFPGYFDSFLFRFLVLMLSRSGKTPDARIRHVCKHYGRIVKEVADVEDPEGEQFFKMRLKEGYGSDRLFNAELMTQDAGSHVAQRVLDELGQEMPRELPGGFQVEDDQVKEKEVEMFLSTSAQRKKIETLHEQYYALTEKKKRTLTEDSSLLENRQERLSIISDSDTPTADEKEASGGRLSVSRRQPVRDQSLNGIVIILSLVCSSLRHVQIPESKVTAIYLIRYFGQYTTDEVRLQRLVPFLLEIVTDPSATVRALTARTITYLVSLVTTFPLSDASIFPQYILPLMTKLPVDDDELVRIAFAECLPLLASTSRRFLEIAHSMKQKNMPGAIPPTPSSTTSTTSTASFSSMVSATRSIDLTGESLSLATSNFDKELNRLHKMISRFVMQLAAMDQQTSSPLVKRALLGDITRLCIFFGRERTLDVVLPQLICFLNDSDWELRGAFFDHITGVCAFVGRVTVELNILPLIEAALIDVEEIVIAKALECLGTLCQLGLFQKNTSTLVDKAKITCSLLLHPSWWVRDAVLKLMSSLAVQLGNVNANVFLAPLLRPFLKKKIVFVPDETEAMILVRVRDCCLPFISRRTFDAALIASTSGVDFADMDSFSSLKRDDKDSFVSEVLDSYRQQSSGPPLLTAASSVGLNEFEQKKSEVQALELMKQYVAVASNHMRSKMELAHQEQTARMQNQSKTNKNAAASENANARKLPRSSLHVLSVPDMRFALSVSQPLKSASVVASSLPHSSAASAASSSAVTLSGTKLPGASRPIPALSNPLTLEIISTQSLIRMYGLVSPNVVQPSDAWKSQPTVSPFDDPATTNQNPFVDTSHFAANGAMVSMLNFNLRDVHGADSASGNTSSIDAFMPTSSSSVPIRPRIKKGMNPYPQTLISESSTDPALMNPRKLLARLTALGVPPMPPDLGALRMPATGDCYSIYAHGLSPHKISQYGAMGTPASSSAGDSTPTASQTQSVPSAGNAGFHSVPYAVPASGNGPPTTSNLSVTGSYARGFLYRNWRPRRNVLVAELGEHCGAVNRIGAAQDSSFLASASNDGTVKIWSVRSMQHSINQGSRCTYDAQGGVLTDMIVLDNSHSVATASTNGTVHVVRVDTIGPNTANPNFQVAGIRELRTNSTAVMVLDHMNNVTESLLLYATRNGFINAWDLRTRRDVWKLEVSQELGFVTCMTHSMDVSWLAAGTSRGYICVWDLRFLVLIRIWRHSSHRSIHRIKPCLGLSNTLHSEEEPLVFVAAGDGEVAVFNLSVGACRAVYRTLNAQTPESDATHCPTLLHVAIPHRSRSVLGSVIGIYGIATAFDGIGTTPLSEEPSVRAILCPSLYFRGVPDALITGGGDKQIRYWDIRNGKNSFTVCGDDDSKSFYDNQAAPSNWWRLNSSSNSAGTNDTTSSLTSAATMLSMASSNALAGPSSSSASSNAANGSPSTSTSSGISKPEVAWSKLSPPLVTICQDASFFASQGGLGGALAAGGGVESAVSMERRGLVPPSPAHSDCVLDLALVDLGGPLLVSSGRDGIIKVWK